MSGTGKTVAKNASVLMASQLITWGLTLLLMLFLPRYLGAETVGQLYFAGSLWAIVAITITFGMDRYLTKEIARYPEKTSELFGSSIIIRTILYVFGFGGVALYLSYVKESPETIKVVYVIGISQLIWQFIGASQETLQGLEQMQYMSIGNIVGKAVNTVVSIVLLLLGYGVLTIAAVNILSAGANLALQLYFLGQMHPIRLRFNLRGSFEMLKASSPYLMARLFLVVYQQVDIVIMKSLSNPDNPYIEQTIISEAAVGWYGVADQLFGTFLFIPTVFMTAVFPALSRMYATGSKSLPKLMSKSFDILLLLSVPIGLGLLVIAKPLVVLLFGADFAPSGPVLAVMGIVLILTYQNILLGQFLVSTDRQNTWAVVMAIATLATIPLDLLIIPWTAEVWNNGAIGGAMVYVITELGMMMIGLRMLPEGALTKSNLWLAGRVLLAGLGMVAATWWVRDMFIVIPIGVGAVTYIALGLLLQIVSKEDREVLMGAGERVLGRFGRKPATS
jgi:O-antigen/teichoic acid export membrane protein